MKRLYPVRRTSAPGAQALLAAWLLAASAAVLPAQQTTNDHAKIYTRDRKVILCYLERADHKGVFWSLEKGSDQAAYLPFTQIQYINFPPPDRWEEAVTALSDGSHQTAQALFAAIAEKNKHLATAPGNYSTRAHFWLLTSLRQQGRLKELAERTGDFDPRLLDKQHRIDGYILLVWGDIARSQWKEASRRLDELAGKKLVSSAETELWFLRGLTLLRQDRFEEALLDFGRAFTAGYGTNRSVERAALREAIQLLARLERYNEVKGLVELYKANYGKGQLWKDADLATLLPAAVTNPPPQTAE